MSFRTLLSLTRLEDRTTPAMMGVERLTAPLGVHGNSSAQVLLGGLYIRPETDPNADGIGEVDAPTSQDAITRVIYGNLTVQFADGRPQTNYDFLPSTVGTTAAEHRPYLLTRLSPTGTSPELWRILLDDQAAFNPDCDFDYNDHFIDVRVIGVVAPPVVTVPQGNITITSSDRLTPVPDNQEETSGGWVAVNNDNDNYNFTPATGTQHVYDKDEIGKVDGENDLVKITISELAKPNGEGGKFRLDYDNTRIKLWKSADKLAGPFANADEVALGQNTELWVEGLSMYTPPQQPGGVGPAPPANGYLLEQLDLKWVPADERADTLLDSVRFTIYQIDGVMNVPSLSKYRYRLRSGFNTPELALE